MTFIIWLSKFISFTYYDLIYLIDGMQFITVSILFSLRQKKRKFTYLYLILGTIIFIAFSFLLGYCRSLFPNNLAYQMLSKLFLHLESLLIFVLCYKEKFLTSLLNWITALSVREIVDAMFSLFVILTGSNPRSSIAIIFSNDYLNYLFFDAFHLGVALALYFLFRDRLTINSDKPLNIKIAALSLTFLLSLVIIKSLVVTYASESIPLYATSECLILLLAFLILFIRTDILHESKYRNEMKIMNQVLAAESNQYESLKENIASINMKAHDIKHQLEHYQDKLTEEEVNELKKSVSAYDKRIDTGSQVLDTVLYFSELTCDKEKITISCLADGKPLNEIEDSKVYYLFNNIIGNAIEATSKVTDQSKRLISLHVYQKDGDMVIEESNYFTGSIVLKGNRIPSSKEEKKGHGYGLKSIALIVSSNGGKENIHTEGDMFFMSISLPLPQNKKKVDDALNAK